MGGYCNEADTANWFRLVKWKYGEYVAVGGSCNTSMPASHIIYIWNNPIRRFGNIWFNPFTPLGNIVPLVVSYEAEQFAA